MSILTVVGTCQEVHKMDYYFAKRTSWGQCIVISVDERGTEEKITEFSNFFENILILNVDSQLFVSLVAVFR